MNCRLLAVILVLFSLGGAAAHGAERDGRWAILIAGSSGDPDLQSMYLKEFKDLRSALEGPLGFLQNQIVVLFDDPSKDTALIQRKSTREDLRAVCRDFAGRVNKDDLVFVFIEGHGNYDGKVYKLNLVGPDPTAEELAAMLYSIPAQRYIVVNATNCSGGSIAALSKPGKVVITSTKSGMETNQPHFGPYFVEAFKDNAADSDKNGRVSMIEAFSYAKGKIEEFYKNEGLMQTEHPVLDDNGDGQGQGDPTPENGEGLFARRTFLDSGIPGNARSNLMQEQQKLAREASEIEMQIEALKYVKKEMAEAEYEKQLEALLLRLAQINAKLPK